MLIVAKYWNIQFCSYCEWFFSLLFFCLGIFIIRTYSANALESWRNLLQSIFIRPGKEMAQTVYVNAHTYDMRGIWDPRVRSMYVIFTVSIFVTHTPNFLITMRRDCALHADILPLISQSTIDEKNSSLYWKSIKFRLCWCSNYMSFKCWVENRMWI